MRKDSIQTEAIEKAYLIYSERGHQIEDYDFSHAPTDYKRGTVEEPEQTSSLDGAFKEILPKTQQNAEEFNALADRQEQLRGRIDSLQDAMKVTRQRGNFQQLQNQMKQMHDLIKEKERLDAQMATANLGAAQMSVYQDTMDQDDFSEMQEIGAQIAALEEKMREFMGE